MSKVKKTIQKNIQRNKEIKNQINPKRNKVLFGVKILYVTLITTILVYGITIIVKGEYKFQTTPEITIDYTDIVAGQSFNRNYDEYYVVFYNYDEESSLTTKILNIKTNKVFRVDLANGINKTIISDHGNKDVTNAGELRVNGTTLLKIENGNKVEYIEGIDSVTEYLSNLK